MGLYQNVLKEEVSLLPLREAILIEAGTSVTEAVRHMKDKQLGCVIVTGDQQEPLGTFTESELIQLLVHAPDKRGDRVESHLSAHWAKVQRTDPIVKVLDLMQTKDLRFVVVTDESGRAVALTGQKGLMEYVANHFPRSVLVQRVGMTPCLQTREGA